MVWFIAVVLFDVAALGLASALPSGAASRLLIGAVLVNQVDAVRTGALLGIEGTGAFGTASLAFYRFTGGSTSASVLISLSLLLWILLPALAAPYRLNGRIFMTRADIERNAATLKNVPLWDHQPLLDTFGQIQEIRTYYDFASVDNDRYGTEGEYRQVMLSARELNSASLSNRTWINERLTFNAPLDGPDCGEPRSVPSPDRGAGPADSALSHARPGSLHRPLDGRLVWIQDAYTTSSRYPYSSPVAGAINYIRNSIKVTVDAYHGRTVFYRIDPDDPVAATLGKAFPDLFNDRAAHTTASPVETKKRIPILPKIR